ncbi:MAG: extracellular solute-binding protein [Chloroflexota bacterium]|nr:extracellular solute-binding protein [Chloroflexota bacterium]
MAHDGSGGQLSRRKALRLAGSTAAAALGGNALSTAAITTAQTPAASPAASPVASPGASPAAITIVPTGAQLPTEPTTFTWMARGAGSKAIFLKQLFPAYQQAHPNITIQYEGLPPAELTRILPLGIRNGNAPDAFEATDTIPVYQMVREGWIRPIDDIMPNFEEWKQTVPPGVLVDGITVFDGKVYGFPYLSNKVYQTLTLFNSTYMQETGYDPSAKPLTWDEFRDAAKKITEQGQGDYYGFIIGGKQPAQWGGAASSLAEMAGAAGGPINWQTGQYQYTADAYRAAIDLLIALNTDGSVFPGVLQLDNVDVRAQIASGVAGMILEGPWNVPVWSQDYPDFQFGVGSQPVPNSGEQIPIGIGPGAWLPMFVYAESENPEIAGDIFSYLASEEGQTALASITGGFPLALSETARQKAGESGGIDPRMTQAYALFEEQVRTAPDPRARNSAVEQVYLELQTLTPNFGEVVQGLFTGQLSDAQGALQDLQDRSEAELERAIKAAQDKGADVSRDDWVFPNWDPTQDYTAEDYAAL